MIPLLIDLDGVLRIDETLAPGSKEFIQEIQKQNIPACILSNTTKLPATAVTDFFVRYGISLGEIRIHTALLATHEYVKPRYKSISTFCDQSSRVTFNDIPESQKPEAVVIGDLGKEWNHQVMNDMFIKVMQGADIIAMHMNKFQKTDGELILDAGAFITAIEYATGKKAMLIGKPSKIFFTTALKKLGFRADSDFMMIGDDLESDIRATQDAGGKGMLIMTGKTNREILSKSDVKPDYIAANLAEALVLIKAMRQYTIN